MVKCVVNSAPADADEAYIKEEALKLKPVLAQIEGKEVRKIIVIKGKVVNIVA